MTGYSLDGAAAHSDGGSARMRETAVGTTGPAPVTIKALPAFGMLLGNSPALQVAEPDEPWARTVRTGIRPCLFERVTAGTSR